MEELSNRLVIILLVLIVVSTVISTIAFLNMETDIKVMNTESSGSGKASLTIAAPEEPTVSTDSAQASLTINEQE